MAWPIDDAAARQKILKLYRAFDDGWQERLYQAACEFRGISSADNQCENIAQDFDQAAKQLKLWFPPARPEATEATPPASPGGGNSAPTATPTTNRPKRVTVNERMGVELLKNPESRGWTADQWATRLDCGHSTVVECDQWKGLQVYKAGVIIEKKRRKKTDRN